MTSSVTAPGDTNLSDATADKHIKLHYKYDKCT